MERVIVRLSLLLYFLFYFPFIQSETIQFDVGLDSYCTHPLSCSFFDNNIWTSLMPQKCMDCTIFINSTNNIVLILGAGEASTVRHVVIHGLAKLVVQGSLIAQETITLYKNSSLVVDNNRYAGLITKLIFISLFQLFGS